MNKRKLERPVATRATVSRLWATRAAASRGQALVEFALVAPLFLLLMFGVVEYSLINASIGSFNFAAKEGARTIAIIGNGSPPAPNNTTPLDQFAVNNVVLPHVTGVVIAQMQMVEVYKADETGNCYSGGTPPGCPTRDTLQLVSGTWQSTFDNWPTGSRNDQLSNADYVGVYIQYSYTYLTAFFAVTSPTINLTAAAVDRIEPQQYGQRHVPAAPAIVETGPPTGGAPAPTLLMIFGCAAFIPRRYTDILLGGRA